MLDLETLEPIDGSLCAAVSPDGSLRPERLLWSVTVTLQDVVDEDGSWPTSLTFESMLWPLTRWIELDGKTLADLDELEWLTPTFYCATHHEGVAERLQLRRVAGAEFDIDLAMRLDFEDLDGNIQKDALIEVSTRATFEGVHISRDQLFPKPNTREAATALLAKHLDVADFEPPQGDSSRYLFAPRMDIA